MVSVAWGQINFVWAVHPGRILIIGDAPPVRMSANFVDRRTNSSALRTHLFRVRLWSVLQRTGISPLQSQLLCTERAQVIVHWRHLLIGPAEVHSGDRFHHCKCFIRNDVAYLRSAPFHSEDWKWYLIRLFRNLLPKNKLHCLNSLQYDEILCYCLRFFHFAVRRGMRRDASSVQAYRQVESKWEDFSTRFRFY